MVLETLDNGLTMCATAPQRGARTSLAREPGSFRDPSGFLFRSPDGVLLRQVNEVYEPHYARLMSSGLYQALVNAGQLVEHVELPTSCAMTADGWRVLRPVELPFISYPYEWCFSQLKDAAILTLDVQLAALQRGLTLKDASAYNVQFLGCQPVLIDTLSFECYQEGQPWAAYSQFCRHFLAPLALMAKCHLALGRLLATQIDGLDLQLTARLLPRRTWLSPGLLTHIHANARMQASLGNTSRNSSLMEKAQRVTLTRAAQMSLVRGLRRCVQKLHVPGGRSVWSDYYAATNYTPSAFGRKEHVVQQFLQQIRPTSVWDLGCNTGVFAHLAAELGAYTLAFDSDAVCVEKCYRSARQKEIRNLLPLVLDLTSPSPALGWAHRERKSFMSRGKADVVLALALIHHLALSNNVPLVELADFFYRLCDHLVIEFVPPEDSQAQRLLTARAGVAHAYDQGEFVRAFSERFDTVAAVDLEGHRSLHLLRARS